MRINAQKCGYYTILYLIFMLLFSGFVEFRIVWHMLIFAVFFLVAICVRRTVKSIFLERRMFVLCALPCMLLLMSLCVSNSYKSFFNNIRSMSYSLFALLTILVIIESNEQMIFTLFKSNRIFCLFNVMLIVNTVILAIQNQGTGLLIRQSWLEKNPTYFDQCAGLFGFNATNVLGLYAVFVMLFNFAYAETGKLHFKRRYAIFIYSLSMMIIQALLSQDNDNIGFYIILIMFLGIYLLYDLVFIKQNDVKKVFAVFGYLILTIIIFVILLYIPYTKNLVTRVLKNRIEVMIHFQNVEMTGSNERLHILRYGLENPFGWLLGKGVGTAKWVDGGAFGFVHFGLSSVGAYVVLAGIWFYLIYTLLYSYILYRITIGNYKKSRLMFLCVLTVMIIFTFYTNIYSDARSVILLAFIAVSFRMLNGKYRGKWSNGIKVRS